MNLAMFVCMGLAAAGGLIAVSVRNILHAIFGLAITLLALAGIFLMLNSPFVAAMEVLIYVGGISVAMVFAVMLSTVVPKHVAESTRRRMLGFCVATAFFLGVGAILLEAKFPAAPLTSDEAWSVQAIGMALLNRYNLVFEALSVVLLLAIVGAIVISGREREQGAVVGDGATSSTQPVAPEGDA